MKVLYVCPLAHVDGHPFYAAITETKALAESGQDVTLLTFAGLAEGRADPRVKQVSVVRPGRNASSQGRRKRTGRFARATVFFLTICKAASLNRTNRHDVIHLRDGTGPFMFLPQALGLLFRGNAWCISLLLTEYYPSFLGAVVRATKTRYLYSTSLRASRYAFVCQNQELAAYYSHSFLGGTLNGRVHLLPLMVPDFNRPVNSDEAEIARRQIGISQVGCVFLSFGAIHPGKDFGTIMKAFEDLPSVTLLQAGVTNGALASAPALLGKHFFLEDAFISEARKSTYFKAASAVILSYRRDFSGTASVLWEACRFSVPVIASDYGQLGELVTQFHIGLIFRTGDAISLREALSKFVSLQPSEVEQMKGNYAKFSEVYSAETWANQCLEIYRMIVVTPQ